MTGREGLFSEGHKALPHSIERQLGLKIYPSAARRRQVSSIRDSLAATRTFSLPAQRP